jgi:hypothetical protein
VATWHAATRIERAEHGGRRSRQRGSGAPSVADIARESADRAADSPVDAGAGSSSGMHRQHEDQGQRVGL